MNNNIRTTGCAAIAITFVIGCYLVIRILSRSTVQSLTTPGRQWITVARAYISDAYADGRHLKGNSCLVLAGTPDKMATTMIQDTFIISTTHSTFLDYVSILEELSRESPSAMYAIPVGFIRITIARVDKHGQIVMEELADVNIMRFELGTKKRDRHKYDPS